MRTHSTIKKKTKVVIFNSDDRSFELLSLAAGQQGISRSAFLRQAMRKEAARVLAGADNNGREEHPE